MFCIKFIQSFKHTVSTDFALCAIDLTSVETCIDKRKLQFLGQLCRLPNAYLAKTVFNHRLVRFINYDQQSLGFIPEIYRLLQKYNLTDYISNYLNYGTFPSKSCWKTILKEHVIHAEKRRRLMSVCSRVSVETFI